MFGQSSCYVHLESRYIVNIINMKTKCIWWNDFMQVH